MFPLQWVLRNSVVELVNSSLVENTPDTPASSVEKTCRSAQLALVNWDGNEAGTFAAVLAVNKRPGCERRRSNGQRRVPVMDLIIPNDTPWTPLRITAVEEHK